MSTNNYQTELQVAAYLVSLARQITTEMERAAEAEETLVAHLREQNELLETAEHVTGATDLAPRTVPRVNWQSA
jgi:uncharacterized protein with von Willebrand factor type A (vWA) domain